MVIKKLFHQLKRGQLTFIGKPLFVTMVTVELLCERVLDRFLSSEFESSLVNKDLTAVIKTFERPKELQRLIESIKRFYPELKIIVVDDSKECVEMNGVQTIMMPYDSGVSAGRNKALLAVKTKYFLLLDDDFIFYRKTDLEPILQTLEAYAQIDILGGEVVNLPLYRSTQYTKARLHPTHKPATMPEGSVIAGMRVQDKVANFYMGRTESIRRVGWDNRIKRLDHADFFTRAKGVLTSVYTPTFKVLHAQTPFNKDYMAKRNDYEEDQKLIFQRYYSDFR